MLGVILKVCEKLLGLEDDEEVRGEYEVFSKNDAKDGDITERLAVM